MIIKRGWKRVDTGKVREIFNEVLEEALNQGYFDTKKYYGKTVEKPELFIANYTGALGKCYTEYLSKENKYETSVVISTHLLNFSDKEIRDTVIHEMGHAICPDDGHNHIWKSTADRIGKKWNVSVSRCSDNKEIIEYFTSLAKASSPYKYEIICPKCQRSCGKYKKVCDIVKYPELYRCCRCHSPLILQVL